MLFFTLAFGCCISNLETFVEVWQMASWFPSKAISNSINRSIAYFHLPFHSFPVLCLLLCTLPVLLGFLFSSITSFILGLDGFPFFFFFSFPLRKEFHHNISKTQGITEKDLIQLLLCLQMFHCYSLNHISSSVACFSLVIYLIFICLQQILQICSLKKLEFLAVLFCGWGLSSPVPFSIVKMRAAVDTIQHSTGMSRIK